MFSDDALRSWAFFVVPERLLTNTIVASAHEETVGFPVNCWLMHGSFCLDSRGSQVDLKDVPMSHTSEV